MLDIMLPSDWF